MRALGFTALSLGLTAAVIGNAYYQQKQFYPTVVYITKSSFSMAVMYMQAFIVVLLIGKLMKKIFFGQLRANEFEHLMERSWYALTETALAFTLFKDDFNPKFIAFFTILFFLKSFHWLAEDRVDYMERSPIIGSLFHIRVQGLLLTLAALDIFFIVHAYQTTVTKGASVQLVYGFEYCILIIMIVNILVKYIIHAVDSQNPWENKAMVLLYTEFIVGFFKVLLYISFVIIMVRKYSVPLFAFRQMYFTIRNFNRAFNDVIMSRRAIRNMNNLYPDATPAELAAFNNVCVICLAEMVTGAKKLPCNHIFHATCLRSWFQRQQICPTCRFNILRNPVTNQATPAAAQAQQQAQQAQQGQQVIPPVPPMPPMPPPPTPNQASGQQQQVPPMPGMPPFPGMPGFTPFMGFPWPPPPMPANLATLTPTEISRMEGRERQHIEARIQCLKNIKVLLDASVMMIQQYSAIANKFPTAVDSKDVETQTGDADECAPSTSSQPKDEAAQTNTNEDLEKPGSSTAHEYQIPYAKSEETKKEEAVLEKTDNLDSNETQSTSVDTSIPSDCTQLSDDESADQVRRRRLQKFDQEH